MMKAITLTLASTLVLAISSCNGHRGPSVPDMPYGKPSPTAPAPTSTPTGEPQVLSDAQLLSGIGAVSPAPATPSAAPAPAVPTTAPATTPTYGSALMEPGIDLTQSPFPTTTPSAASTAVTTPTPAPAPVPVTQPTAQTTLPADTATPVAVTVQGDPHRVYNPWNPNQRIRITDPKTGLPFPSGKVLGIPGTTKKFIVP